MIVIKATKIFGKSLFAIAKLESYGDQVKSFSGYILVVVVFANQFIARTELKGTGVGDFVIMKLAFIAAVGSVLRSLFLTIDFQSC